MRPTVGRRPRRGSVGPHDAVLVQHGAERDAGEPHSDVREERAPADQVGMFGHEVPLPSKVEPSSPACKQLPDRDEVAVVEEHVDQVFACPHLRVGARGDYVGGVSGERRQGLRIRQQS